MQHTSRLNYRIIQKGFKTINRNLYTIVLQGDLSLNILTHSINFQSSAFQSNLDALSHVLLLLLLFLSSHISVTVLGVFFPHFCGEVAWI